jgi:SpoVK/Ycf46/Vps4 family AAA+-type ATPase
MMKIIKAIAGDRALWIATANKLEAVPPELKRRFTKGIYFFDLPNKQEREDIWEMYLKKFELGEDRPDLPNDEGWTGANIYACCANAWEENCSLQDAAASIVPPTRSDPEGLKRLREMARGKFLSVNSPGVYDDRWKAEEPKREIEV